MPHALDALVAGSRATSSLDAHDDAGDAARGNVDGARDSGLVAVRHDGYRTRATRPLATAPAAGTRRETAATALAHCAAAIAPSMKSRMADTRVSTAAVSTHVLASMARLTTPTSTG